MHGFDRTRPRRAHPQILPLVLGALGFLLALGPGLPTAAAPDELVTHIYDVTDLVHPRPDFPAPRLGLGGLEEFAPAPERNNAAWTMEELVELIQKVVDADLRELSRAKVAAIGSKLVISLPARSQERVATVLGGLRDGGRAVFTVEARWIALPDEALTELGFRPERRRQPARNLDAEQLSTLLGYVAERDDASVIQAPRLSLFTRQRAHVVVVDQQAYVADFERDPVDGSEHPVIDTLNTGMTLEVRVRPRRTGEGVILDWNVQVAQPVAGSIPEESETEPELRVPEIATTIREGRAALTPDQVVAVPGLPNHDAPDSGVSTLLVLGVTESRWEEEEPRGQ